MTYSLSFINSHILRVCRYIFFTLTKGPYINCTDGSLEYVDKLLDWALKYNLTVLLDIHGIKDSQNGFDNSGQTSGFEWTSLLNDWPIGLVTFEHWPVRSAKWMVRQSQYKAAQVYV